jgi:aerobic-type carbon monoxide dehydrogenase small subunit (CoxS/CutS family)
MKREIALRVNNTEQKLTVDDADTLLEALRDQLKLFSVRESCGVGACGSCTVLMDGAPVSACFLLAVRASGKEVITLEGLGDGDKLHYIQEAFVQERALQCAYCTPGFVLTVKALLDEIPNPTEEQIKDYLAANLSRCAGYAEILSAVRVALEKRETF